MFNTQFVLLDEDHQRISTVCDRLVRGANAKGVYIVDKNG